MLMAKYWTKNLAIWSHCPPAGPLSTAAVRPFQYYFSPFAGRGKEEGNEIFATKDINVKRYLTRFNFICS